MIFSQHFVLLKSIQNVHLFPVNASCPSVSGFYQARSAADALKYSPYSSLMTPGTNSLAISHVFRCDIHESCKFLCVPGHTLSGAVQFKLDVHDRIHAEIYGGCWGLYASQKANHRNLHSPGSLISTQSSLMHVEFTKFIIFSLMHVS